MIGHYTGIARSFRCKHCGQLGTQRQLHIEGERYAVPLRGSKERPIAIWIMAEHKTKCGAICSPRHAETCLECPPLPRSRRQPRNRTKSEVTASPILGQLSVAELRVLRIMSTSMTGGTWDSPTPAWFWLRLLDIKSASKLRDTTVRDALRKLAARGVVVQHRSTRRWRLNLSPKLRSRAEPLPA